MTVQVATTCCLVCCHVCLILVRNRTCSCNLYRMYMLTLITSYHILSLDLFIPKRSSHICISLLVQLIINNNNWLIYIPLVYRQSSFYAVQQLELYINNFGKQTLILFDNCVQSFCQFCSIITFTFKQKKSLQGILYAWIFIEQKWYTNDDTGVSSRCYDIIGIFPWSPLIIYNWNKH